MPYESYESVVGPSWDVVLFGVDNAKVPAFIADLAAVYEKHGLAAITQTNNKKTLIIMHLEDGDANALRLIAQASWDKPPHWPGDVDGWLKDKEE